MIRRCDIFSVLESTMQYFFFIIDNTLLTSPASALLLFVWICSWEKIQSDSVIIKSPDTVILPIIKIVEKCTS